MCTSIKLKSKEGNVFWGRTMDIDISMFGEDPAINLDASIISIPSNTEITSQHQNWTTKYAATGIGVKGLPVMFDGINEHGMAGDFQVLVECEWGEAASIEKRQLTAVLAEEFITYVLTQYKTVAELKKDLASFAILNQPYMVGKMPFHMPLHFAFVDETGEGVVVEPVNDGAFKVYDYHNAMTNSPEYDYHQTNIRNYIGLNTLDIKTSQGFYTEPMTPIENGTGYGFFGLPGDYTSPSRFVRSFILSQAIDPFVKEDGINQLYSVFRPVIIPRGLEHATNTTKITDYTRYWSGYDLSNRSLYIQSNRGLSVTEKTVNPNLKEITYDNIDISNNPIAR